MSAVRRIGWRATAGATVLALLVACGTGPVRRVSEPSVRIQQLAVQADGSWSIELRLENFSSVAMRFDAVDLALSVDDQAAGRVQARPAIEVGPESADVVTASVRPEAAAKIAVADALARGHAAKYRLVGRIDATPDEGRLRVFDIERASALNPAPGLPGVLR